MRNLLLFIILFHFSCASKNEVVQTGSKIYFLNKLSPNLFETGNLENEFLPQYDVHSWNKIGDTVFVKGDFFDSYNLNIPSQILISLKQRKNKYVVIDTINNHKNFKFNSKYNIIFANKNGGWLFENNDYKDLQQIIPLPEPNSR